MEFNTDIAELTRRFGTAGFPLFAVGGCVRDKILDTEPDDVDLATSASTEDMERVLGGLSMDFQGKSFGVMYVNMDQDVYQIATFRKDSPGRKPTVETGVSIEIDAFRRDFSCNAIYFDLINKNIVDPTGGVADIKNKILRTPGKPEISLGDDPLRKLRALRFGSTLDFKFDETLHEALLSDNSLIFTDADGVSERVSQERIWLEFAKAVAKSKDASRFLRLCQKYSMFDVMFPSINFAKHPLFFNSKSVEAVLAGLIGPVDMETPTDSLMEAKMSEDQARGALLLSRLWLLDHTNVKTFHRMLRSTDMQPQTLRWFAHIARAAMDEKAPDIHKVEAFLRFEPTLAEPLIADGWKQGKPLGDELMRLDGEQFLELEEKSRQTKTSAL